MAKKASGGMSFADEMVNYKRMAVALSAASTTYVYSEWDTGLSARGRLGIMVLGFQVQPKGHGISNNNLLNAATRQVACMQLHEGPQQGALLNADDERHIGTISVDNLIATAVGLAPIFTPWGISCEKLTTSPKITACFDAGADAVPFQSGAFGTLIYTVAFRYVNMTLERYIEASEQRGAFA